MINSISNLKNINSSDLRQINGLQKQEIETEAFSSKLENAIKNKEKTELKKATVEFESYFLNMMFKSMRKTITTGTEKSMAEETFQEMLDDEMSKNIAKSGGIGFADMMYTQLSKDI